MTERGARLAAALDGVFARDRRNLIATAIVQDEVRTTTGASLVLVGGSAVAAWNPAVHVSYDIDLVGFAVRAELDRILSALGFRRDVGRHWWHEELDLAIEIPADSLEPGSLVEEQALDGGLVLRLLSLEDLVVDRVEQWDATGHEDLYRQAALLDADERVDRERLDRRLRERGIELAAAAIRWLFDRERRGELADSGVIHAAQRAVSIRRSTLADVQAAVAHHLDVTG